MIANWTTTALCVAAVIAGGMGCGAAAGPPAGPEYKPSNTEQALTPCPKEREAAQLAREALLGAEDAALVLRASEKVLAQGQCEAAAALAMPVPTGTQDQILAGVTAVRVAVRDASSLFGEVRRYGDVALSQKALLDDARLTVGFAELVGLVQTPGDMDPNAASAFRSELNDARQTLMGQAKLLVEQALASEGAELVTEEACALLASLGGTSPACL